MKKTAKPRKLASAKVRTLHNPYYVEVAKPDYTVALQLDKTTLEGHGTTVLEALRAIKKPVKITTKSILTVMRGEKKHSRGLTIPLAQRLFRPGFQIYQAKNLELLLK